MMKSFAAHYIYLGSGKLLARQVVSLDEAGIIVSVQPFKEETASTVFFNGIICPTFSLPGSIKSLTPSEATSLFSRIQKEDIPVKIADVLDFYTNTPDLKIGAKIALWCIDPVDLTNLFLLEETKVYSVFP